MIWLIGMMGSGKSAVGAAVSELTGAEHVDTDSAIEQRSGESISRLFDTIGEPTFRLFEASVVRELAEAGGDVVVSTGGGAVLDATSVRRMRDSGCVVWLSAGSSALADRVGDGTGRPLLRDGDTEGSLEELLTTRTPLYRSAAHHVVETAGRPVPAIAEEVGSLCRG